MTTADPNPAQSGTTAIDRPSGEQLRRVEKAFLAARDEKADTDWAERAFARLVFSDVQIDVAEQILTGSAETLAEAQEEPSDLWGDPSDWADRQVEELKEAGVDAFDDSLLMGLRESVLTTLGLASGLGGLFFLSELASLLLGDGTAGGLSVGFVLAPLLLATLLIVVITVYKRAMLRFSFPVTIGACVLTVAAGATVAANIMVPLGGVELGVPGVLCVLLVPLYAGLAWVLAKVWPKPTPPPPPPLTTQQILDATELPDGEWLHRARVALRGRGDLPDARIDGALAEARDHSADVGSSLVEEFGSPEDYARSIPADPRTASRRLTLLYSAAAVLWPLLGLIGMTDPDWSLTWSKAAYPLLMILCAWRAIGHGRRWRRAAQG